jgi:hypothetical protein
VGFVKESDEARMVLPAQKACSTAGPLCILHFPTRDLLGAVGERERAQAQEFSASARTEACRDGRLTGGNVRCTEGMHAQSRAGGLGRCAL